jgi:competence ComEA-like helix-hairpin-helix protein
MRPLCAIATLSLGLLWAADDPEAKRFPDGPGKEVVGRICIDCHGSSNFRQKRLSKDEWTKQVDEMIAHGANINDDEYETIITYLAQNFGPDSKVNVNTAPAVELKSVLAITVPEAKALVDYRDAKGNFQRVEELEKVPGVDAKKIEAAKDRIAF